MRFVHTCILSTKNIRNKNVDAFHVRVFASVRARARYALTRLTFAACYIQWPRNHIVFIDHFHNINYIGFIYPISFVLANTNANQFTQSVMDFSISYVCRSRISDSSESHRHTHTNEKRKEKDECTIVEKKIQAD